MMSRRLFQVSCDHKYSFDFVDPTVGFCISLRVYNKFRYFLFSLVGKRELFQSTPLRKRKKFELDISPVRDLNAEVTDTL